LPIILREQTGTNSLTIEIVIERCTMKVEVTVNLPPPPVSMAGVGGGLSPWPLPPPSH
jgi:hypothetical protein